MMMILKLPHCERAYFCELFWGSWKPWLLQTVRKNNLSFSPAKEVQQTSSARIPRSCFQTCQPGNSKIHSNPLPLDFRNLLEITYLVTQHWWSQQIGESSKTTSGERKWTPLLQSGTQESRVLSFSVYSPLPQKKAIFCLHQFPIRPRVSRVFHHRAQHGFVTNVLPLCFYLIGFEYLPYNGCSTWHVIS